MIEIGVMKNVNVAPCGMKNINRTKETRKILGIHISYNKKIEDDVSFRKTIKNLCNVIKLWHMKKLSSEGKITIFKPLAVLKIVIIKRTFKNLLQTFYFLLIIF